MARPPQAREKVLDAFATLIIDEGERSATMDATARAAGVSKGGLIYHFPSKLALEEALAERLDELIAIDIAEMEASPAGVVDAFIRTALDTGSALDRVIVAVGRLANTGSEPAITALARLRAAWRDMLRPHVRDETALDLVMLVSDGVYFNEAMAIGSVTAVTDMSALIALVSHAIAD